MVMRFRPRTKATLQRIAKKKAIYERRIEVLALGRVTGLRKRSSSGLSGALTNPAGARRGCRDFGGGRRDEFKEQKEQLKQWALKERAHGHALNTGDLWREYKFILQQEANALAKKAAKLEEGSRERALIVSRRQQVLKRIEDVSRTSAYLKYTKGELAKYCGLRLLKPQRLVNLSPREEHVRCELTWQAMDRLLWLAAFGTREDLRPHVLFPEDFIKARHEAAIILLDQVPFRAKIAGGKQLYFRHERPVKGDLREASREGQAVPNEGQSQTRGQESENADKCRITVELRQVILHFFSKDRDPVGIPGPTCVIVAGNHCRLSNIDEHGRWKRTERFWYDGKEVVHEEGRSARNSMLAWQTLRRKRPGLFEGLSVMAQPAAVVDNIIQAWQLEELGDQYPCSICQRDMLGSYRSASSQKAMQVIGMLDAPILGKMTAVLQVTDTDIARPLKVIAAEEKEALRAELKLKAVQEGVKESFVCKAPEVMRIVARSIKRLNSKLIQENTILKAARRNYMLSYRPDFQAKRLVRSDSQPWAQDLPEGSHRLKASWCEGRYSWLDSKAVPAVPDYSRCAQVKRLEDLYEHEFCCEEAARMTVGGEEYEVQVGCDLGTFGGFNDEAELKAIKDADEKEADDGFEADMKNLVVNQMVPEKRALFRNLDELLSTQGPLQDEKAAAQKAMKKEKVKAATKAAMQKWRSKALKDSKGSSKRELLDKILLSSGKKAKAFKKVKGKATTTKAS
jgi:hypothetical protein